MSRGVSDVGMWVSRCCDEQERSDWLLALNSCIGQLIVEGNEIEFRISKDRV